MSNISRFGVGIALVSCLMLVRPAAAQATIYATGFEPALFADGSVLVGQDGWTAPDFLSPNAAIISTSAAKSGAQGLQVRGSDLTDEADLLPDYAAVGSYRKPTNYFAGTQHLYISADVRVEGPVSTLGPTTFFGASIAARFAGVNGAATAEFQLSSEGLFVGFNGSAPVGSTGVFTPVSAEMNRWYNMAIKADFEAKLVSYILDGVTLGASPFTDPTFDTLVRGSLVVYATPNVGDFNRNDYVAKFDNFGITAAAPEPATLALLAFGIPMLIWRKAKTA